MAFMPVIREKQQSDKNSVTLLLLLRSGATTDAFGTPHPCASHRSSRSFFSQSGCLPFPLPFRFSYKNFVTL